MKRIIAALAFTILGSAGQAATLLPITLTDPTKVETARQLFGGEIKRDQNVNNNGGSGKDAFLRNGTETGGPASFNVAWGASGTSYAWSIAYDGDIASLTLGSETKTLNVTADGLWTALSLFVRAQDDARFSSITTAFSINRANGAALSTPLTVTATNGTVTRAYAFAGLAPITSLQGTLSFAFTTKPGATGSPNSRVAVNFGAVEAIAPVPVPAALPLLATVIGSLALVAWRRRAAA